MVSDGFIHQERRWVGAERNDCVAENGMVASKHPLIGDIGRSLLCGAEPPSWTASSSRA